MTEQSSTYTSQRLAIGQLLRDFLKVIKVVATYPENNPLPKAQKQRLAADLLALLDKHDEIRITVEADKLNWEHDVVYFDRSRDEALAGLFFHTGITTFAFTSTMTASDLDRLIDVFRDCLNNAGRATDLAGEIWEAGIGGFEIETVEDISLSLYDDRFDIHNYLAHGGSSGEDADHDPQKYAELFSDNIAHNEIEFSDSGPLPIQEEPGEHPDDKPDNTDESASLSLSGIPTETGASDRSVSSQQPSSADDITLIFNDQVRLSEDERQQVAEIVAEDALFEPAESTVALLKEMLNQEIEFGGFCETLKLVEKIAYTLIDGGELLHATRLIDYLGDVHEVLTDERKLWADKVEEVRRGFGVRERMRFLASALNRHRQIGAEELKRYLNNFDWQSLSAITDLLGEFDHRHHRETLCDYLAVVGRDNIDIIAKTMYDKRWFVVRNSVMILGRIGDERALDYIKRALHHEEFRVRRELLDAVRDNMSRQATALLREMVFDPDEHLRVEALKALLNRRSESAFDAVSEILDDPRSREALSHGQMRQVLTAYSQLGGADVLEYLNAMITPLNLFGNKIYKERRLAAFIALAENPSDEAEELLLRLSKNWRSDIKHQARLALSAYRQRRYGDEQSD